MAITLDELKGQLLTVGVVWKDVGSDNPDVANGYFEREDPVTGGMLRMGVYLHDKTAPLTPDLVRLTYRRLMIVGDTTGVD